MKTVKRIAKTSGAIICILILVLITILCFSKDEIPQELSYNKTGEEFPIIHQEDVPQVHVAKIQEFIKTNNYAPYCIVVDFSKAIGTQRLYIYDADHDRIDVWT